MNSVDVKNPESHSFGHWRFEANTGELFDGETTTRLEPQVAKLLDYFLTHQNTLTSRDELITAVWQNRTVSDDAINRCVSILRQLLSPDDKNAYIETVIRRGFISHFPDASPETSRAANPAWRKRYLILAVLVGVTAVVLYAFFERNIDAPPELPVVQRAESPMVAVLPFTTSDMTDDSEFFADGMHDDLLTQLAQLQSLRVISRTSMLEYRDRKQNIREIGQELGADAVLEGGVQSVGNQIRFNVQLIDARTDVHLWAEQYDRELTPANIFDIQADIARAIASAMQTTLTEQDTTQLAVLPTENMAAYRAYHRAMEIRDSRGVMDPENLSLLEEAVALDPTFVRAWAELAGLLSFSNFSHKDPDSIWRIEEILVNIQKIAPDSAEHLIAQSYYTYYILKNYELAYELIEQAQKLRPSDERVVELKSWIERRLGDYQARIESVRLARKLDPRNPIWTTILVNSLITIHEYEKARQEIEHSTFQNFRLSVLRSILQLRDDHDPGRWREALLALEQEYGTTADPQDLWDSHIAARDYTAAENLLNNVQATGQIDPAWTIEFSFNLDLNRMITYWFLQADERLESLLLQGRTSMNESRNADGENFNQYLVMAFVTAAEGNTEETERLIRAWQRSAPEDFAEYTNQRHHSCRALGMAAATEAAVECIRSGLAEPSFMMPFIEPYLPYYDSIRDQAEFIELLAEIQGQGT